ncbi:MAG TPA: sigma factor-like helix-turn-helix DNA-binding protein [Gemmataceae bacterium]|nr:sigma factor-like helix-turn-helix DNA-binding protein [Gemmataceae bacterium]
MGSFLYGVAYRIAMKERGKRAQRRQREQQAGPPLSAGPLSEAAFRELQLLLDEGLNRLPEKYRTPFVLCCLEGKSKSEAARELGWKDGTLSSRLAQARKEMQQFLSQKGVTLATVLTAAGIAESAVSACVPPLLAASSVRVAMLFASGTSAAMETAKAVQLAETVLRSMAALPWKTATALLMAVSLAVGGAGMAYHAEATKRTPASEPPNEAVNTARKPGQEREKIRTDRYGDPLPQGALSRLGTIRFRQGFFTGRVAFSPNGKIVACVGKGRGVCLWDAATGKQLQQIGRATDVDAINLAFSPNGRILACKFEFSGGTALFETATGRKLIDLPDDVGFYPGGLAFAPDGKTIAAGTLGSRNRIHFFDAATGAKRKMEISVKDEIYWMAWSPDSKKIVWGGEKGSVHLWDAIEAVEIGQWKAHDKGTEGKLQSMALSPDGKTLATASPHEIVLWDIATHEKKHTLDLKHFLYPHYIHLFPHGILFSRDGRLLASGHCDGTIALWDVSEGKEIRRWQAHSFPVWSLDFSPDGKTLVSGAIWECGPRLWDVATGAEARAFAGHTAPVERVMFAPDGKRILSVGREKKILEWNLIDEREAARIKLDGPRMFYHMSSYKLSPRGDVAASCDKDHRISLWDVATGKERRRLDKLDQSEKDPDFWVALEFSPDSRWLAFALKGGVVSVWDMVAGVERWKLKGLADKIHCITFSRDGKKIAAASRSGNPTIGLWDLTTGKSLVDFSSRERVDWLAFSPDAAVLASASFPDKFPSGSVLRLWDVTTGRPIRQIAGAAFLYGLAFSPDGKWLAGTGDDAIRGAWDRTDQKVQVWEVMTGLEVRCFRGHVGGGTSSIAFSPDGRALASGGADSSILLWDFTGRMKDGRLQTAKWTPRDLEQRWMDLASMDGARAVQALWDLVASPGQAVLLLCHRIKPAEAADAKRIERLIRDLDSGDFQTRTKATEELEKIVDRVEPALRKTLTEKPSLEMRRRIEQVLSKLEPSGERLRALRAIQVLEYAGTAEAREHLRALAKGIPEARLTCEAKAALERLVK